MYLDAAEEKMLRAILQSAVVSAAAGHSFVGEFRHYRISATCLRVNEQGVARIEARIVSGVGIAIHSYEGMVLAARDFESAASAATLAPFCDRGAACLRKP
jgi:hypothetical protein